MANREINVNIIDRGASEGRIYQDYKTTTDKAGRFTFERVTPGRASVALVIPYGALMDWKMERATRGGVTDKPRVTARYVARSRAVHSHSRR